ncbi:MAG: prepilin-type N-terminal cleavage/methylation domain-containing protein [Bdellovibrionales bacterium]|nr:prepilin-type N-terminal cleavage/methylation domain-containing protein [Bdellovibrionales bacterium]
MLFFTRFTNTSNKFIQNFFLKSGLRNTARRAFTLVEVLVVLILVVFILSWSTRKMFSQKGKIRTSFQVLNRLNRSLDNRARLHGKTYRLVLKLNPDKEPEEFWVEKKVEEAFVPDKMILKNPGTLHPLLSITSAESEEWEETKTEGVIHIHYHPRGLGQEVALHLERWDTKARWTIYFDPITRELSVIDKHVTLKEMQEDL